jgi:hypothetical protein
MGFSTGIESSGANIESSGKGKKPLDAQRALAEEIKKSQESQSPRTSTDIAGKFVNVTKKDAQAAQNEHNDQELVILETPTNPKHSVENVKPEQSRINDYKKGNLPKILRDKSTVSRRFFKDLTAGVLDPLYAQGRIQDARTNYTKGEADIEKKISAEVKSQYEKDITVLKNAITSLKQEIKDKEDKEELLNDRQQELDNHKLDLDDRQQEIDKREKNLDAYEKQLDERKKQLNDPKQEINDRKKQLDADLKQELDAYEKQHADYKQKFDAYTREFNEYKKQHIGLDRQRTKHIKERNNLIEQKEHHITELDELKKQKDATFLRRYNTLVGIHKETLGAELKISKADDDQKAQKGGKSWYKLVGRIGSPF